VNPELQYSQKKLNWIQKAFETNQSKSMKSSRTTYRPDRHPKYTAAQNAAISANSTIQGLQISIEVMPVLTLDQLRAHYEEALRQPLPLHANSDEGRDQTAWKYALSTEISRCTPKPMWMKRKLEHPSCPTQHAKIDQTPEQLKQLDGILTPETLRRTFISIPMLMKRIQSDLHVIN
jgi:hypothetical protein